MRLKTKIAKFFKDVERFAVQWLEAGIEPTEFRRKLKDLLQKEGIALKFELNKATQEFAYLGKEVINDIYEIITKGFTHYGKTLDKRIAQELKNYGDVPQRKLISRVRHEVRKGSRYAYTWINTAQQGAAQAKKAIEAVDAGYKYFRYVGPPAEREFCKEHLGKVYSIAEIKQIDNGQGLDVFAFRGGYNCRHRWRPVSESVALKERSVKSTTEIKQGNGGVSKKKKPAEAQSETQLTKTQAKMKDLAIKKLGVELPDNFFKDDFEEACKIYVRKPRNRKDVSYYSPAEKAAYLKFKDVKKASEWSLKKTAVHELTHHRHHVQNRINSKKVDESVVNEFMKHYNLIDEKKAAEILLKPELKYANGKIVSNNKYFDKFLEKHPEITIEDAYRMHIATADYFGALTNEKIGYGHGEKYYSELRNSQFMEWFAHCSENYYVGNKFFEEYFPELYKMTIEFMRKISND